MLPLRDLPVHYEQSRADGPPVVLIHPAGLSLRVWDDVVPLLPPHCRVVRYDLRGHGGSGTPAPPYSMGALVRDAESLMDALGLRDAVVVGLSLGGLIAQGLAVKRLDLVRGLVLSNTAARIPRTAARRAEDEAADPATLARRFLPSDPQRLRPMLEATDLDGWRGAVAAAEGTDFYTTTATLTLPTLVVAGAKDAVTPPDLVRETAELIRGADFRLMRDAGHLPCLETPAEFAALVTDFLNGIGH